MKPALEKFLIIAATLAAIGLFVFVALWSSIKEKKTQMDDLFNNTNVPTSMQTPLPFSTPDGWGLAWERNRAAMVPEGGGFSAPAVVVAQPASGERATSADDHGTELS